MVDFQSLINNSSNLETTIGDFTDSIIDAFEQRLLERFPEINQESHEAFFYWTNIELLHYATEHLMALTKEQALVPNTDRIQWLTDNIDQALRDSLDLGKDFETAQCLSEALKDASQVHLGDREALHKPPKAGRPTLSQFTETVLTELESELQVKAHRPRHRTYIHEFLSHHIAERMMQLSDDRMVPSAERMQAFQHQVLTELASPNRPLQNIRFERALENAVQKACTSFNIDYQQVKVTEKKGRA
jgi:hypothetical protein